MLEEPDRVRPVFVHEPTWYRILARLAHVSVCEIRTHSELFTSWAGRGPFTRAAMNPARATGPMLASSFFPRYWYIYWVGQIAGALLVGVLNRFYRETD